MGITVILLIIVTSIFSYKGLTDNLFLDKYVFEVEKILVYKDYKRLVTSGFLHLNWQHLIFNMLILYFFSSYIEFSFGPFIYLLIYFTALIGSNLFSLLVHKNDAGYSSLGASGAVNGIIFAVIALYPGVSINFFIISIPAWLYGLVYVLYSIYGIRSRKDNIGHDAHLAGAVIGVLFAILLRPIILIENYITIGLIIIPAVIFIYIIITRPDVLLVDNFFFKSQQQFYSIDHKYNANKVEQQKEVDAILEKIHKKGMDSLSKKEKQILEEYSKAN